MESGKILIDTSILIEYFRKKNVEDSTFYNLSLNFDFCISIITEFEFLVGFPNEKLPFAKEIITGMEIFDINKMISSEARKIYLNLKKLNKLIPFPDVFIAATAITYNIPLATLNKKHFRPVETLVLL